MPGGKRGTTLTAEAQGAFTAVVEPDWPGQEHKKFKATVSHSPDLVVTVSAILMKYPKDSGELEFSYMATLSTWSKLVNTGKDRSHYGFKVFDKEEVVILEFSADNALSANIGYHVVGPEPIDPLLYEAAAYCRFQTSSGAWRSFSRHGLHNKKPPVAAPT